MIALFKFVALDLFICKRLHYADASQRILKAGVDISNLPAVFHEGLLHPAVLPEREDEHTENQNNQREGKPPVD